MLRVACALLITGLSFATPAFSQTTYTWDGDTDGNWGTAANWLGNAIPVDAGAAPENIVRFDSNSDLNLLTTMNLTSGFDLSQITIVDPAGTVTIRAVNNSSRTIDLIPVGANGTTIDMSAATQDLIFANQGTGVLVLNVSGAAQTWNVAAGRTLTTVDVDGSTTNVLTLTGGGTVVLGGTTDNGSLRVTVSGGTLVNLAKTSTAAFHALGGNATSTIELGTTMRITGTGGDQIFYQHDMQVDGLFDLNGNSEGFDALLSGSGITTGVITTSVVGNVTLRISEGGGVTGGVSFGGVIQDGAGVISLVKAHSGTQVFAGNNTYSGSTTLSRGLLHLLGVSGALSNTSGLVIDGAGELRLDSRSTAGGFAAGVNNDRIADDASIEMRAGTLSVYGVSSANVSETIDDIIVTSGYNVIRLSSDTVAGTTATGLTATSITRSAGTVVGLMGDNLTAAASFGTVTTGADAVYFRLVSGGVSSSMLSGASGAGVNRDILVGFFGSGATGGANGSDFVTVESGGDGYDYLRPLLSSEYAVLTSGEYVESNALSSAVTTLNSSTAYNALKISGGSVSIGANKTLFLGGHAADAVSSTVTEGAGMLLLAGGSGINGGVSILGTVDFGTREAIIRATSSTANIDAKITGSAGLLKTGNATLLLNNANAFTGGVSVLEGVLQVRNDKALGAAGGNVSVGAPGSNTTTVLELAAGVNVTGENVTLGASGTGTVGFRSGGGHNTWGGDVIASNVAMGGRSDSESSILVNNDTALTIYGRVYTAPGIVPTANTYNGNDNNFTRRIGFGGSGSGVVNLYGTLSDTATGVAASAVDRLRVNMSGNSELNVNIANQVEVTGLFHLIQGYMRYEGTGNFFHTSTGTTDRVVLFDVLNTGSGVSGTQVAFLLTKDGQSFHRRSGGNSDIQIGNGSNSTGNNILIGGENESGVVTYGNGNQRLDFAAATGSTDLGRFRDLRLYARQGGEVNILMDIFDDTGFGLTSEIGAITKVGLGTVRLTGRSGVNNDLDGGAYALGGTLLLDYSTVTNAKIQNATEVGQGAQFTTAGGDLRLIKTTASATPIIERMAGNFTVHAGGSEISIDAVSGSDLTLRLATASTSTITRQAGGTVNFVESGAGAKSIVLGLAANQNTRLGSYATYGTANNQATAWAFIGATNDVTSYTHTGGELNTFGATLNTDLTANQTLTGITTTNSIRFNDTAVTSLDLGGFALTVTEGGLLIGSGHTGPLSISNGSMTTGGANDLIIHNYGTGGLSISADITGGAVTYAGTGVTTLVGAKSYTGTTYLVGGTVSIATDGSLGNAVNALYFNGGELQTTASFTIARAITIGGDAAYFETVGAGTTTTLSGVIAREGNFIYTETNASTGSVLNALNTDNTGVGDIIKTGLGTLLITGNANTFSGVVDVREGTLQIDLPNAAAAQLHFGTNESWLDGTIIRSGATLTFNKAGTNSAVVGEWFRMENNTTIRAIGGGRFQTSGLMEVQGALTIEVATGGHFDHQGGGGYLYGDGDITKTGAGTYMILGNNTLFTGSFTVLEGLLGARGQGMVTGSDFSEVITVGGTAYAEYRRLSLNEFTNNQLVEGHNIVVTGSGDKRIGYGNFSVPTGDDFVDFNGTITLNANASLNVETAGGTRSQTAYLRFNGALSGVGNATTLVTGGTGAFSRTGVFELNADNSAWTGGFTVGNATDTPLNQHILRLGNNNALQSDNAVTLRHNSRLQAAGRTVTAGNLSTSGVVGALSNEIVENAAHADGTIAFTQTANGNWDALFRDGTPIGTIYEQDGNATVGRLNLVKEGAARATLMLDNQYTGGTTVNAGILEVGSGGSATTRAAGDTGTGATTSVLRVNSGGRVAGTGTVQGIASTTTHFVSGGIISPGDVTGITGDPTGIGTLDVIGNLDASSGTIQLQAANSTVNDLELSLLETGTAEYNQRVNDGVAEWEPSSTGATRGDHDLLNINGQLVLDSNSTVSLEFTSYIAAAGDIFDLLDWIGALGGTFDVGTNYRNGGNGGGDLYLPTLAEGLVYDVSKFNSNGIIIVANAGVVPEPGRALLLVLGVASVVLRRRRRSILR